MKKSDTPLKGECIGPLLQSVQNYTIVLKYPFVPCKYVKHLIFSVVRLLKKSDTDIKIVMLRFIPPHGCRAKLLLHVSDFLR